MSVTLRKRKLKDGSTSLLLDIYENGTRRTEFLTHLRLPKISNALDRAEVKEKLELANRIRLERAKQLEADDYGIDTSAAKKTQVLVWLQHYVDNYRLKDKRNMQGAVNRFKNFLSEIDEQNLTMNRLSEILITDFRDYLQTRSTGEGASSYFSRFKKMVKHAYKSKLLINNPALDVKVKGLGSAKKKDVLSIAEIQTLAATPTESKEVKRAFLFSCVTGLRWIDIKEMTWQNVYLKSEMPSISVRQSKTSNDVVIKLNQTAIELLGEPDKNKKVKVFDLPTANGANKTVKAWVKRAGIEKQITWHNARHSFGTNLIFTGTDILTASKLIGHTSMKHTQRYVAASEEMKQTAVDKLNFKL